MPHMDGGSRREDRKSNMNGKRLILTSSPLPQDSERNLERRTLKGLDVQSGEMNTKTQFLTHRGGVLISNLELFKIAGFGK